MNSKIRALIWEEMRVGGAITLATLLSGMLCVASSWVYIQVAIMDAPKAAQRASIYNYLLRDYGSILTLFTLGTPIITALLLILGMGNSGHLAGGFSRRILRLPASPRSVVAVPLMVRLAEIMILCMILWTFSRLVGFGGPAWSVVFLLGAFYVCVQLVDWFRTVAPFAAISIVVGIALAPLLPSVSNMLSLLAKNAGAWSFVGYPAVLVLCFPVAFVAGVAIVRQHRCGETLPGPVVPSLAVVLPDRYRADAPPFASSSDALFWHEMRHTHLIMPKMTFFIGVLFCLTGFLLKYWYGLKNNDVSEYEPLYFFVALPLVALFVSAICWNLFNAWRNWPRKTRKLGFDHRLPIPRAAVIRARLAVAGVNLAISVGMAWVLYTAYFLTADDMQMMRILGDVFGGGAVGVREIVFILVGPAFAVAFVLWLVMFLPTRFVLSGLVLILVYWMVRVAVSWMDINILWDPREFFRFLFGFITDGTMRFILLLPPLCLLLFTFGALWLGWLSKRSGLAILAVWLGIAAVFYSFGQTLSEDKFEMMLYYCLFFSAWLVAPYPALVMMQGREGLRTPLRRENSEQHRRFRRALPRASRIKTAALSVTAVLVLCWLRWPSAQPRWEGLYHAKGLPGTREELNNWYPQVPPEKNLALRYVEAGKHLSEADNKAFKEHEMSNILVVVLGGADLKRTGPVSEEVYQASKDYWNNTAVPVAAELHEIARSGLTESRYPIDLTKGFEVELPHLARIRALTRILALESLLAALEKRPDDATAALVDMPPIAESFKKESLLISQLVRCACHGIAIDALEKVMNRMELSEANLVRLQNAFAKAVPPLEEGAFMDRAIIGEAVINLTAQWQDWQDALQMFIYSNKQNSPVWDISRVRGPHRPLVESFAWIETELLGFRPLSQVEGYWLFETILDASQVAARSNGSSPCSQLERESLPSSLARTYYTVGMLTSQARCYDAEWRVRTQLNIACTAIAVERFRLANGRLPNKLDEMVPAFLDKIPNDPWNNCKPLSYRIKKNGGFVVYSFAKNGTDEKGEEEVKQGNWWTNGDITFTVAPVEIRNRPQVEKTERPQPKRRVVM